MFQRGEWQEFSFCGENICIYNKLIKSQSPHKATHFRGQLFQLPDIFRFFDFLFGGSISLTALVLFSCNRNAAFFTDVLLAKSVSPMWFKDRPRFSLKITLHLSEIANYFVIITERFYLIQRRSNLSVKLTRNEHDSVFSWKHFERRPPKLNFWNEKKIVEGRVWLITAVKIFREIYFTSGCSLCGLPEKKHPALKKDLASSRVGKKKT